MEATIRNRPTDLQINTVTITKRPDIAVHLFRCTYCSGAVAQFQGKVISINPNIQPHEQALVINRCRDCNTLYTFLTVQLPTPKPNRVVLHYNPFSYQPNHFHCHICRHLFLYYDHETLIEYQTMKPLALPLFLQCPDCGEQYAIVDLV